MKIPRKKVVGQKLGAMSPQELTPHPVHGAQHESRGRENNNNLSRIYIIFFMEFTGDIIDVIKSSFQFFPFKVRNLWNKTRNTQYQVINVSSKSAFSMSQWTA